MIALSATRTFRTPVFVASVRVRPSIASTSPTTVGPRAAGDGEAAGLAAGLAAATDGEAAAGAAAGDATAAAGDATAAAGDAAAEAGEAAAGAVGFVSAGFASVLGAAVGAGGAPPHAASTSVAETTNAPNA